MTHFEIFLGKVTAFITRHAPHGTELLLFEHPFAGIQLPAGTLEESETPEQAALREAAEETGLTALRIRSYLGFLDWRNPGHLFVIHPTKVYSRPDTSSFDWVTFPRGAMLRVERQQAGFIQGTYEEPDVYPDPNYMTYTITGWVPESCLGQAQRRHFFHLEPTGETQDGPWEIFIDNHTFHPFWARLDNLPEIVAPQRAWLDHVQKTLRYNF